MNVSPWLFSSVIAALAVTPLASPATAATLVPHVAPSQAVNLSVHLPLRNSAELDQLIELQTNPASPLYHHFLSVAQFRAAYGPTAKTFARLATSMKAQGFAVTAQSTQALRVRAAAASVEHAFGTQLGIVRQGRGAGHIAAVRPIKLTPELAAMGVTVTGLENRPLRHVDSLHVPLNRYGPYGDYWFTDLKEAYTFPSFKTLTGKGATIGIVIDGDVLDSDTNKYFDHEKFSAISGKPVPTVFRRPVFGGAPFGGVNSDSAESSIDVQTSLGSAPGAQVLLYNIPNLGDDAVIAGYTDVDEDNVADVVSSSFGGCELDYTAAYNGGQDLTGVLKSFHELYRQGNAQGITFLASSGDFAGLQCPTPSYYPGGGNGRFVPSVSEPASDPNVTAVGGTNLETTAPPSPQPKVPVLTSKYVSENAYGDRLVPFDIYGLGTGVVTGGYWGSGSGASKVWAKPSYQVGIDTGVATRAVPDVSMQMGGCPGGISVSPCHPGDSASAYFVGGTAYGFIGTSLSSPEFAGLLALKVAQAKERLGNVNPLLYKLAVGNAKAIPFQYFHQNIAGYNGVVHVSSVPKVYNRIIGVGTPNTRSFLGVPTFPLAGTPQTPSNP